MWIPLISFGANESDSKLFCKAEKPFTAIWWKVGSALKDERTSGFDSCSMSSKKSSRLKKETNNKCEWIQLATDTATTSNKSAIVDKMNHRCSEAFIPELGVSAVEQLVKDVEVRFLLAAPHEPTSLKQQRLPKKRSNKSTLYTPKLTPPVSELREPPAFRCDRSRGCKDGRSGKKRGTHCSLLTKRIEGRQEPPRFYRLIQKEFHGEH